MKKKYQQSKLAAQIALSQEELSVQTMTEVLYRKLPPSQQKFWTWSRIRGVYIR